MARKRIIGDGAELAPDGFTAEGDTDVSSSEFVCIEGFCRDNSC